MEPNAGAAKVLGDTVPVLRAAMVINAKGLQDPFLVPTHSL